MHADQMKVRQGLFNLLSNAVKFTHAGTVTVNAGRELMDDREWIVFRVADTGIGLSAEQILKLFQDFTQADTSTTRKFGGTGLGLALTRRFCQMMGGDVTVHSVPGEGSVFTIKLPAEISDHGAEAAIEAAGRNAALPAGEGDGTVEGTAAPAPGARCVLVIDDEPVQRDLMQRFLSREGFHVCAAAGGEEGLRLARELRPVAITLDVMMPEMDGWSVLQALKADAALCDIPVIMLTMLDDPARGFALGAADYATKPVNRERLSRILRKHTCPHPPCCPRGRAFLLRLQDSRRGARPNDNPDNRDIYRTFLQHVGYTVLEAGNGEEGVRLAREHHPALILMDLGMPVMGGLEATRTLKTDPTTASIPVLALTAHAMETDRDEAAEAGCDAFIPKPVEPREVLEFMERFLESTTADGA